MAQGLSCNQHGLQVLNAGTLRERQPMRPESSSIPCLATQGYNKLWHFTGPTVLLWLNRTILREVKDMPGKYIQEIGQKLGSQIHAKINRPSIEHCLGLCSLLWPNVLPRGRFARPHGVGRSWRTSPWPKPSALKTILGEVNRPRGTWMRRARHSCFDSLHQDQASVQHVCDAVILTTNECKWAVQAGQSLATGVRPTALFSPPADMHVLQGEGTGKELCAARVQMSSSLLVQSLCKHCAKGTRSRNKYAHTHARRPAGTHTHTHTHPPIHPPSHLSTHLATHPSTHPPAHTHTQTPHTQRLCIHQTMAVQLQLSILHLVRDQAC